MCRSNCDPVIEIHFNTLIRIMIWSDLSLFCLGAITSLFSPLEVGYTNIHYAVEIPSCGFQGIFNPKTDNSLFHSHCPGLIRPW